MAGYFKVSMEAAKAIVGESDNALALAGYMTLCNYAFSHKRDVTAAGAKCIKQTLGCSHFRSKKILDSLRAMRFGTRGESGLITTTDRMKANAPIHRIEEWPGEYAYVPSLLFERNGDEPAPIARLVDISDYPGCTARDALLLLLHCYASTDYSGWFGCPSDLMASQEWRLDGYAGDDFELGYRGDVGNLSMWLVGEPEEGKGQWTAPRTVILSLFGPDLELARERFWIALRCLQESGLTVRVLTIQQKNLSYPLWIFSPEYRTHLSSHFGRIGDLAMDVHRVAGGTDVDYDNLIIRYATGETGDLGSYGTGVFFCLGSDPRPYLVIAPRLHAPTPINLDGIRESAATADELRRDLRTARRLNRDAA